MAYMYTGVPGKVHDFLCVLERFCNPKAIEFQNLEEWHRRRDPAVEESYESISALLDPSTVGLRALLTYSEDQRSCYGEMAREWLHTTLTLQDCIQHLRRASKSDLARHVLRFYYPQELNDKQADAILADMGQLYSFVYGLPEYDDGLRWDILRLLSHSEDVMPALCAMLENVARQIDQIYGQNEDVITDFAESINNKVTTDGILSPVEPFPELYDVISQNPQSNVVITGCLLDEFAVSEVKSQDGTVFIFLGIHYLTRVMSGFADAQWEELRSFGMAIGDSIRIRICRMLIDEELYARQIAERLELTASAVSYHMELLFQSQIITCRNQGKRVYYSIRKSQIARLHQLLDQCLLGA